MANIFHNLSPKSLVAKFLSLKFHKYSIKIKINIYNLIPTILKFTGNFSLIISFILIFHC